MTYLIFQTCNLKLRHVKFALGLHNKHKNITTFHGTSETINILCQSQIYINARNEINKLQKFIC